MKKRLIFIDKSLDIGGIQTSMIDMINTLADIYEIDLFLYNPVGGLSDRLDKRINVIGAESLLQSCGIGLRECLRKGSVKQKIFRLLMTAWAKVFDNRLPLWLAFEQQKHIGHYDAAISYHHETEKKSLTSGFARFSLRCVDADQRIAWIHNDALAHPLDEEFNDRYYRQLDKIVCVSNSVRNSFIAKHPSIDEARITVCYNFLDFDRIYKSLQQEPAFFFDKTKFNCFSACRLKKVKGIPRAVNALSSIIKQQDARWYIAGDGDDKAEIEQAIRDNGSENHIFLIGEQANPYVYMQMADMVMLVSYFEAAPMLYSEARFLKKPVFTTRIVSADEMLEGGKCGVICENTVQDMQKEFSEVLTHREILTSIVENLTKEEFSEQHFIDNFNAAVLGN